MAEYKINMQNSVVFELSIYLSISIIDIYINDEKAEKEIRKTITLRIASKIKYLRIIITKDMKTSAMKIITL
jgi:hypothetical protein